MFVHLNCHSNYSFLAGAGSIDDLVRRAAAMGCPALALTDTNGLYGAVTFYRSALDAGIRPILGTEITGPRPGGKGQNSSSRSILSEHNSRSSQPTSKRAVILAKNLKGFGEICRVITNRHLPGHARWEHGRTKHRCSATSTDKTSTHCPRNEQKDFSLTESLKRLSRDVIILCRDEDILQSVASERGGGDLYAELTRFPGKTGGRLLEFARRNGLPCAATNRVFFLRPEDWPTHRLLTAIRTNTTVHSLSAETVASEEAWMKPPDEMLRLFRDVPESVHNTLKIAEQCGVRLPIGDIRFPEFALPPDETDSSYLSKLTHAGTKKLYGNPLPGEVLQRLCYELEVIDRLSFAPYFLIVWDIVREARSRGIPTVGRGSAANSLVCRALGITEVDPIRHNLYFERFLNLERTDYPDIDIDFPWNRRDEMLDYVFAKYGHEHVALISAHVHLRGRSALREAGKALGIPISEIDAFTKRLPHSADLSRLEEVRKTIPECRGLPLEDEPYKTMIAFAKKIDGFPRHLSVHCGGIVISPFSITDRIPLEKTPKGFVVTQYDMYPVEDMGLLKIDLLSQRGLAVLADTVRNVEERYGTKIDFCRIDPVQDPKTRALVRDGKTIGCFYIESPGMRNLLQKLGVDSFEMLTAASSIIRPGVADSGMMKAFIDRHNGREKVRYLHPKMEEILKETFGVMIYQEDVIKVAHAIAGMSLGEAEGLRKCMSKKRDWEDINNYKKRFFSGARKNGVARKTAEEIWRQIESFAGYAFCKAHSASFAIVSYQTAYLKAHYPTEFMAAVLSNGGGFYDACAYVEEARRMETGILPPHVNHSSEEFTACGRRAICVGLGQVKGLSQHAIGSILDGRKGGPYVSLPDFLSRAETDLREAEALIRCGALDGLGATRPEMLWRLKLESRSGADQDDMKLLPSFCTRNRISFLKLPEYGPREKLLAELEHLDLAVSAHLLSLYDVDHAGLTQARDLIRLSGRIVTLAGWLVTAKRTWTVKHQLMKFLMLEDATASFEVTLFPKIYKRFGSLLYDRGPYIVKGRVEAEGKCRTVTALWLGRAGQ